MGDIVFRKLQENDLEVRVEWMNSEKIYRSMGYTPPITYKNTVEWFHRNESNECRVDFSLVENGSCIAMSGLTNLNERLKLAEVYIFVDPESIGCGFGTLMLLLTCHYGLSEWGLHKIYGYADEDNLASSQLQQKIGFKQEGLLRDEVFKEGRYKNRLYFGMLKEDFNVQLFEKLSTASQSITQSI